MPVNRSQAIDEMVSHIAPVLQGAGIPTQYPNVSDSAIDKRGIWSRVTFVHDPSFRASLGARRERHTGQVYVQFFLPKGTGGELIYTVPQAMLDALTDLRTQGGVWMRNVSLFEDGESEETTGTSEAYYTVTVQALFTYDEFRT